MARTRRTIEQDGSKAIGVRCCDAMFQAADEAETHEQAHEARRLLVHWQGTPQGECARRDAGIDEAVTVQANGTTITTRPAYHQGNVTCPVCRRVMRRR